MIELLLLAAIHWHHFDTHWKWDESPGATHYWFCVSDTPADFVVSLVETDAVCSPVLNGTEYHYYNGFAGPSFPGSSTRFFSVVACNEAGCSGFAL